MAKQTSDNKCLSITGAKYRRILKILRPYSVSVFAFSFVIAGFIAFLLKLVLQEASWTFALTTAGLLTVGIALLLLGTTYALLEPPGRTDGE